MDTTTCKCCRTDGGGKRKPRFSKTIALYCTMVVVSTLAIYFLEHASIASAFRTALVAAIGKTFAAGWVMTLFE